MKYLICLALFLCGCGTASLDISKDTFYKRDIKIRFNNKVYNGVAVLPKQPSYKLEIFSEGDFDFAVVRSCAREMPFEKQGDQFNYLYTPNENESTRACPLEIHGFDKDKSSDSDGFVDFLNDNYTMSMTMDCNGVKSSEKGVSVCQSASGLIQTFVFLSPVVMVWGKDECKVDVKQPSTRFDFELKPKQCLYLFRDMATNLTHRLTTLGYEKLLPRKL